MAYDQKKTPDKVEEQPGSKQKKLAKNKDKSNKQESAPAGHPQLEYGTYKRNSGSRA